MNDIHKRGGTILGTSRGGHDTSKIVDSIQDRGINQVSIFLVVYVYRFYCMLLALLYELSHVDYSLCAYAPQVYILGGDGTQKGASVIFEVMQFEVAR